jgi:hypothetical protein
MMSFFPLVPTNSNEPVCCWTVGHKADGFDPHSIYYDPEVRTGYVGEPAKENKYQPFLNKDVALDMLLRVFEL